MIQSPACASWSASPTPASKPASRPAVPAPNLRRRLPAQQLPLGGKPLFDALLDALLDASRHALGTVPVLVGPTTRREELLELAGLVQSVHFRHVVNPQIEAQAALRHMLHPRQHCLQQPSTVSWTPP